MPRAWRSCLSSWSNRVIIRGILCAIGVRQTMAQWDAPSPTLLRLILRYGFAVLSVADRTRFNKFSMRKFGR